MTWHDDVVLYNVPAAGKLDTLSCLSSARLKVVKWRPGRATYSKAAALQAQPLHANSIIRRLKSIQSSSDLVQVAASDSSPLA